LCGFPPPHFCGCWNASHSFIATAKTSYTAGTLCAIWVELVGKYNKINNHWKMVDKIMKTVYYQIDFIRGME
jgi:hypothetical protein